MIGTAIKFIQWGVEWAHFFQVIIVPSIFVTLIGGAYKMATKVNV